MTRISRLPLAATLALQLLPPPALALEYQLHGFAAQGLVWSDGNDVLGDSREGEFQYFELGGNGIVDFGNGLLFSAQEVVRRAGPTDPGKLRLDFAQLDYRYWQARDGDAGVRIGKVKIPYGFYNATRDVIFARPGILLPDSIYSDSSGQQRSLMFASEGGQLYGEMAWGAHELSLVAGAMLKQDLNEQQKSALFTLGGLPYRASASGFWHARLLDEISGGRWQIALSHLHFKFNLQTDASSPVDIAGEFETASYPLSLRYNAARFSLTAEYAPQRTQSWVTVSGSPSNSAVWSDGGYLQGEYRFHPQWTALARIDAQFADRSQRDGKGCETATPTAPARDRHHCFAYTSTLGVNWQPDERWGVWAEYHLIDGLMNKYSLLDNRGRTPDPHWGVALLMAAYRF